jgi:hypothetical protein
MAKDLKQGSMHVEPHNPVMEYSKADGGDYLNPYEERAELLIDAHKNYYGVAAKGMVVGLPSHKLGKQESSTAGEAGGTSESRRV